MNPGQFSQRYGRFAFLIPLAVAVAIRGYLYHLPGITSDGHIFLQIARNIRYGIGLGWQGGWVPPFHSILIAITSMIPGVAHIQAAAGFVAITMGVLATLATYALAVAVFNRTVAVSAATLVAVFPHFIFMSFSPESEITYTVLQLASLALILAAVRRRSMLMAALAGAFFSMAYMARSEGFLVMVMVLGLLCAFEGIGFYRTLVFRLCAVALVVFFVVASPYLVFLKKEYGAFVISPKSTYVLIWMQSRIYHDNDKGETGNEDLWGLTADGRLKWQKPSGLRDIAAYLMSHPAKSLQVYLHNLSTEIPGRIPNNSGCQHYPQVYPLYLVIPCLFAAFRRWGEQSAQKKIILFSPLLLLLILPVFTDGWWRYLAPYTPLIVIGACAGIFEAAGMFADRFSRPDSRVASGACLSIAAALSLYYVSLTTVPPKAAVPATVSDRLIYAEETRKAAETGPRTFGPGRNYMVPWNKMIYYLDGIWTAEPVADYFTQLQYARKNGVEYIVREFFDSVTDDELKMAPPGISLATVYRSQRINYGVAFYRVHY
ncbi:MAG: glycosyltransferase family 39 protein [Geobacteraceae bacterium]|nr:glycosyltransferase family 39 protein [Geobacteraceae bacterium]